MTSAVPRVEPHLDAESAQLLVYNQLWLRSGALRAVAPRSIAHSQVAYSTVYPNARILQHVQERVVAHAPMLPRPAADAACDRSSLCCVGLTPEICVPHNLNAQAPEPGHIPFK